MFSRKLLAKEFAEIGISEIQPLVFSVVPDSYCLSWRLNFRLIGFYRWEIDGWARYSHATATSFARLCLREFGGELWSRNEILEYIGGFPIGVAAHWQQSHALRIQDLTAGETAKRIRNDVEQFVLPYLQSINSDESFFRHLIADETPLHWHYSQPLTRFAEIAFLARKLDISLEEYLPQIEKRKNFMNGQLGGVSSEQYINAVIQLAQGY